MKKGLFFTAAIAFSFNIFAGGIENKTNMSTGYLRNPSRNTESSRPEACFYNIAGTGFMEEGLYIELGNQFIEKEYKHDLPESDANVLNSPLSYFGLDTIKSGTYNDETTVYLYPNADIVYKFNDFSVFANFGIYAGGGKLEYSEGTAATELAFMKAAPTYLGYLNPANTSATAAQIAEANAMLPLLTNIANNHSLTIDSITYGEQIGLAYNIKDILSLSAGVRMLEGHQKLTLKSDGEGWRVSKDSRLRNMTQLATPYNDWVPTCRSPESSLATLFCPYPTEKCGPDPGLGLWLQLFPPSACLARRRSSR